MPGHASGCTHPRGAHAPKHWVVAEMLGESPTATVVVDGRYTRGFANLARITIAPTIAIVARLQPLIDRCVVSRQVETDRITLGCGAPIVVVADPVAGPYGHIRAVSLWAGGIDEQPPPAPAVGIVEWDAAVVVAASSAGRSLLFDDQPLERLMLPEMLACFDWLEDRSGFLSLLSIDNPADQWFGAATRTFSDGCVHKLHLAARASGTAASRSVRALVCDIADAAPPTAPDIYSSALRNVPILPGHALALIDLSGMYIHDWVADDNDPISGWAHHRPLLHPEDQAAIGTVCKEMLEGTRTRAHVSARVRFDPADEWIQLESQWRRIVTGDQPQALADVVIVPPIPPSVTDKCTRCQRISDRH
ncbi:DUF5593 domain-containing protein [Nocardia puris]|nr:MULTISPECIES: GAF domain-containing protein [Nocardia]MBF6137210.1 DUF5593 domain-containing protein [Nocardia otitidiscaviarum]MBF6181814.1 DUF5593 domain-containing protein [Nocardia otitidiscaviarum]MBF6461707.1 DUF5593 domain-containing protein [Nocardia puris]